MPIATRQIIRKPKTDSLPLSPIKQEPDTPPDIVFGGSIPPQVLEEPKVEEPLAPVPELLPATILAPALAISEPEPEIEVKEEPAKISVPNIPDYSEEELATQAEHLKPHKKRLRLK